MEILKSIFNKSVFSRRHLGILVFCVIWLTVLLLPAFRLMWRVQIEGLYPGSEESFYQKPLRPLNALLNKLPKGKPLTERYQQDVRFLALNPPWQDVDVRPYYDNLIEVAPKESWLIALRLRQVVRGGYENRIDPELEAAYQALTFPALRKSPGTPSAPSAPTAPSAPPAAGAPPAPGALAAPSPAVMNSAGLADPTQILSDIAAAQMGRRLEPDNSFYDWMLAYFYFAANRDQEALAALHEGAKKPRYDDHVRDEVQVRIALREMARPLFLEEKIGIAAAILYPHLAKHRNTARFAVLKGSEIERAGDHAWALQIYADVARLGGVMRDTSYTYINALVGIAIQPIAWQRFQKSAVRVASQTSSTARYKAYAQPFVVYARAHGHPEMGAEAMRQAQLSGALQDAGRGAFQDKIYYIPMLTFYTLSHIWQGQTILIVQILLGVPVWLFLTALTWNRDEKPEPFRLLDVASNVLICWGIIAALGTAIVKLGYSDTVWLFTSSDGDNSAVRSVSSVLSTLIIVMPILQAAVFCPISLVWRHRKELRRLHRQEFGVMRRDMADNTVAALQRRDFWKQVLQWALAIGTLVSWAIWLANGCQMTPLILIPLQFTWIGVVLWVLNKPWLRHSQRHPQLRPASNYGIVWLRQSIGASLLLASVLYFALSCYVLPIRESANARFDTFIARGETAIIRENVRR